MTISATIGLTSGKEVHTRLEIEPEAFADQVEAASLGETAFMRVTREDSELVLVNLHQVTSILIRRIA